VLARNHLIIIQAVRRLQRTARTGARQAPSAGGLTPSRLPRNRRFLALLADTAAPAASAQDPILPALRERGHPGSCDRSDRQRR
jgi:hypothetical protein